MSELTKKVLAALLNIWTLCVNRKCHTKDENFDRFISWLYSWSSVLCCLPRMNLSRLIWTTIFWEQIAASGRRSLPKNCEYHIAERFSFIMGYNSENSISFTQLKLCFFFLCCNCTLRSFFPCFFHVKLVWDNSKWKATVACTLIHFSL